MKDPIEQFLQLQNVLQHIKDSDNFEGPGKWMVPEKRQVEVNRGRFLSCYSDCILAGIFAVSLPPIAKIRQEQTISATYIENARPASISGSHFHQPPIESQLADWILALIVPVLAFEVGSVKCHLATNYPNKNQPQFTWGGMAATKAPFVFFVLSL